MLSRVADSLYWMSRYFERADHCARVLDATFNLMLDPSKFSTEQRWYRVIASLGAIADPADPHAAMISLASDAENRASIVSCIAAARENAGQVREQISSEMWERLNRLYHEVTRSENLPPRDSETMQLVTAVREGSYRFYGVTDVTMSHGEGWHFIQLGKYMERVCTLSVLLDAHFSAPAEAGDLDWVGLLASCSAFEAYCQVYTADLKPERVIEFLLLNPEFPYSVRYSVEHMREALRVITETSRIHENPKIERIMGRLRGSLAYSQIEEIMEADLHKYLNNIIDQCRSLHAALHKVYIEYPVETAIEI